MFIILLLECNVLRVAVGPLRPDGLIGLSSRPGPLRPDGLIGVAAATGAGLPALEGVPVALVVPADLLEAVAAELLEDGLGERDGHPGLAHHSRSGHRAD